MKTDKLISKLFTFNLKKKELNTLLNRLGFSYRKGKGSHEVWSKEDYILTVSTHNKEVPRYILKELLNYLREYDLLGENDEKG